MIAEEESGNRLIYAKKSERDGKATISIAIWRYHYCQDKRFVATRDRTMRFLQQNFLEAGCGATPDTARISASIRSIAPLTRSTHHIQIHVGARELFRAVLDFSKRGSFNQANELAREIGAFLIWDLEQWDSTMVFSEESQHHIFLLIAAKWRC